MKKSSLILIIFSLVYLGGSFIHELISKKPAIAPADKLDTIIYSLESFHVIYYHGDWEIKIRQDSISNVKTIMTRETFDSVSVFFRNDTLYLANHRTNTYEQETPRNSAVCEITLPHNQTELSIITPSRNNCFYSIDQVKLKRLSFKAGYQAEHQFARFRIANSSIVDLNIAFDFVNRLDYSFISDTIQNVQLKLYGTVSAARKYLLFNSLYEQSDDSYSRRDSSFINSIITNYAVNCFGTGWLDLGSNTPGKITGKIDGAITLCYPETKDISKLTVGQACTIKACTTMVPPKRGPESLILCDAKIRITSTPVYLPVYADKYCWGRTNETILIPSGTQHIRIKSGPKTFDTTVTLKKGTNKGFNVDLR